MQQQVVAANVEYKRHGGSDARDVRKVLVRADADVYAAGDTALFQLRDDMQIGFLIRDEIVGIEVAAGFGELLNQLRKRRLRERWLRRPRLAFEPNAAMNDARRCIRLIIYATWTLPQQYAEEQSYSSCFNLLQKRTLKACVTMCMRQCSAYLPRLIC
jgi:hypothetical protein